jgi:hypothetical protein
MTKMPEFLPFQGFAFHSLFTNLNMEGLFFNTVLFFQYCLLLTIGTILSNASNWCKRDWAFKTFTFMTSCRAKMLALRLP